MFDSDLLININIKKKIIGSIWCFCILFFSSLFSQNLIKESSLFMSQLGVREGLSSGGINSMAEDNDGFLWLGTSDGLNRYDGCRIRKYINEPGNPTSLLSNYVDKILIDSRGWVWIITRSGGLHIYNAKTDDFLRMPVQKLGSELFEDPNGDIWCQTDIYGYNVIHIKNVSNDSSLSALKLDNMVIKTHKEMYPDLPNKLTKKEITFSKNNELWLYDSETLFNYKLKRKTNKAELLFKTTTEHLNNIQLIDNPNKNEILLSSDNKILIFDEINKKLIDSINIPSEINSPVSLELIDYKNRLWIITDSSFYRVNLTSKKWEKINIQGTGFYREQLQNARSIIQDSHKNIWIGTRGYGTFKHSIINEAFNYFGSNRVGPSIHKIDSYNNHSLVVSTTKAKATSHILDYKNNTLKDVFLPDSTFLVTNELIFNVFFKDSNERYWLPSRKLNSENFKLLILDKNFKITNEIDCPKYKGKETLITYLFETQDNEIWGVGSVSKTNEIDLFPHVYLSKWSKEDKKFYIESVFEDHPKDFMFNNCSTSLETPDKSLWFGFENGGLLKYDPIKKVWKHLLKKSESNHKNYYNILSSHPSLEHPETNFWIGSRSGLIDFNFKNETFNLHTEKNGLKNNVIYGILADKKNNLWMSTNNGICRFNSVTNNTTNFSIDDGIQSEEFNRFAYFKKEDGTLFFGGVGGLTWFNPEDLETKVDNSKIKITGLKLNNKIADSLLFDNTTIKLPYDQRLITFEFAKLNLTTANRNKYVYKLEKDSKSEKWTNLGNQTSITFTGLPPDDYTFFISTYNSTGDIDVKKDSISFKVSKPWWSNNWLRLLVFVILVTIIYYFYFIKVKTKIKLENLKNNISRDLHDEIGSTLSSIAMYGTIAEKELISKPEKAMKLIRKINSYSTRSIESMNDIVWSIKSENETLERLIKRIRFYLSEIEDSGNWQTTIKCDARVLNCTIDSKNLRNLFLIIKEGINNSLKHSNGNKIDVRFLSDKKNKLITVEIEDDGVGIDLEKNNLEDNNGLNNMQERAEELNGILEFLSQKNNGCIIRLVFNEECKKINL